MKNGQNRFEHMTENAARRELLNDVRAYYEAFHAQGKTWQKGDRISYAGRVYDHEELCALTDATLDFWLTAGTYARALESELASYLNVAHCLLVNSGSSANLLAFMALTSPLLGDRQVRRGDEMITVAAGFPTTVAPAVQFGVVPVFVDVTIPQYNLDISMLEEALSDKTKVVMAAHTLGNPFDLRQVRAFCDRHGLWLIEDNCDALGSEYMMEDGWCKTGTVGDLGTSSFYPPHHMTMGEGGAVYTNNALLAKIVQSMRDWGRDCMCPSGQDNLCGHRFDGQYGELPKGYDHKYVYSHFGYNLKATDLQAAIGCAQLKKLPSFVEKRRANFERLSRGLSDLGEFFVLPEANPDARPSWFGFLLTCKEGVSRDRIVSFLEAHGIQTRMLFAGNLIKHPCFDGMRTSGESAYRVAGDLRVTDRIMRDTFWVGVYPGMMDAMLDFMSEMLHAAIHEA